MRVYLVHHGEAAPPDIDVRRPLTSAGQQHVEGLARDADARGVRPAVIWHSGKLRARQTADAFRVVCNPLATCTAERALQPGDPPVWIRDRLRHEPHDILIAGHFPHLPRLMHLLLTGQDGAAQDDAAVPFPTHGIVALESEDGGETWHELWRLASPGRAA